MEFKIGGKITLSEDKKFYILDILEYKNEKYLFCTTATGKIKPVVLKVKEQDEETLVKIEKDPKIIRDITCEIIEKGNSEILKKFAK